MDNTLYRNNDIKDIITKMSSYLNKTYTKGNFKRDAHPKSIAIVKGLFKINSQIPETLKKGIFKNANTYNTIIRFSNASHKIQSDNTKDLRGISIKLLDIPSEKRYALSTEKNTQDFLLMSHPVMPFGTIKKFRDVIVNTANSKLHNKILWALKNIKLVIEASKLKKKHEDISSIDFWSSTTYSLGESTIVKYKITPKVYLSKKHKPDTTFNKLKNRLSLELINNEITFDFCVQLYKNDIETPLHDMSIEWLESVSPFIKVVTLTIPKQELKKHISLNQKIQFSPANSLNANKPVGEMNEARAFIYQQLAQLRKTKNSLNDYYEPTNNDYSNL